MLEHFHRCQYLKRHFQIHFHYLAYFYIFKFYLPNADSSSNLIIYELNDDDSINDNYKYNLTYLGNNYWQGSLRYLSDFYIQDTSTLTNKAPTYNPPGGDYYTNIMVTIKALPHSTIYYTIDGSNPTIDSNLFILLLTFTDLLTYNLPFKLVSFCTNNREFNEISFKLVKIIKLL